MRLPRGECPAGLPGAGRGGLVLHDPDGRDYAPFDVEDNSVIIVRVRNGTLGVIDCKWGQIGCMPFGGSYHGREGTITANSTGRRARSSRVCVSQLRRCVEVPVGQAPRPGVGSEAEYLASCLLTNRPAEGVVSRRGKGHPGGDRGSVPRRRDRPSPEAASAGWRPMAERWMR
jgi:hypothetical protein